MECKDLAMLDPFRRRKGRKKTAKNEWRLRDLRDDVKSSNVHAMGSQTEGREKQSKILEEIMAAVLPNTVKIINTRQLRRNR